MDLLNIITLVAVAITVCLTVWNIVEAIIKLRGNYIHDTHKDIRDIVFFASVIAVLALVLIRN